ncbi:hypothetical protein H2203_005531 [Taxawa tesnikishii (nom. ined.)]|nr:hypothetical protein H2203_005531 [Dothideales sp. JES 119]
MATSLPPPAFYDPTVHTHLLPSFAALQITCILTDHTIATFLPPFSSLADERVISWWHSRSAQVSNGTRVICMQLTPDGVLAGYVMLNLTGKGYETGPHRGEVEKLLVHPNFRRMGVAKRVMGLLEEAAREEGTWLLVRIFDFGVRGSGEELMRRHSNSIRKKDRRRRRFTPLGLDEDGEGPDYGISPKDGSLKAEVFFYKDLRKSAPLTY